jgi:hypothetical protein
MERSKFYWAEARPSRNGKGFVGAWGAPGMTPGYAKDENGRTAIFDIPEEAELAAYQRMAYVINHLPAYARSRGGKDTYQKLSGSEFANLAADADATLTAIAFVFGQKLSRIHEWVIGVDEKGQPSSAPHWARVMLEIFKDYPETFDLALDVTEEFSSSKRPAPSRLSEQT